MRKFVVKHFVLSYSVTFTAARASRIIMPLMILNGILELVNPNWPEQAWYNYIALTLLAAAIFFGFIYFIFYPVKFEELDESQKYQFGLFFQSNPEKLTTAQWQEWKSIEKKLRCK